jgi:hypothetical protein
MKIFAPALLAVLIAAVPVQARPHWSTFLRDFTIAAPMAADMAFSIECQQRRGAGCVEQNPLLGPHPSPAHYGAYFAVTTTLLIAGAHLVARRHGEAVTWLFPTAPLAASETWAAVANARLANQSRPLPRIGLKTGLP